jgi:hypothetical protein
VKSVLPLLAALAAGLLGLCACKPTATPTPDARPVATVPLATTAPQTPTLSLASPDPEPGAAWTEVQTEAIVIRLPPNWRAGEPDVGGVAANLPAFEQDNPELAQFLGGAGPLTEIAFSALDGSSAAKGFADNLNIRRTALDGQGRVELPEMAATIAAHYRQLGFEVLEATTDLETGGLPSARIAYALPAAGRDGKTDALSGLQLLVAAPDDLWILTYTTTSDRFAALRPAFEESAGSFKAK